MNLGFDRSLSYSDDSYRTPYLHPLFAHNELILKEKGLLKIEQPIRKIRRIPACAPDGSRTRTTVSGHRILSPACLPVPPPGQIIKRAL